MLVEVRESSQAGDARRKAVALAEDLGMDEVARGNVALATTEMATNLVKHAGQGHILLQPLGHNGNRGLRLMSVDKGPGIADVQRALSDGHSTAGSMGTGLGAIRRRSDSFDLYSLPGAGTVVSAEFWQTRHKKLGQQDVLEIGVVTEPIAGEDVCGDGWGVRPSPGGIALMVADGLGHGLLASEAAREAEQVFAMAQDLSPKAVLHDAHSALKKTRGAAMGVVNINIEKGVLSFAGIGNISAAIVAPGGSRSMPSHNGTLGQQMERVQEFSCPWNRTSILVMHSDGLATRWDLERYPGIWQKHPSLIAAILHRDFSRGRDDVTVLVAKPA
jgi:anti-sigma regulatory factor (Ser/Thr protein kinase)